MRGNNGQRGRAGKSERGKAKITAREAVWSRASERLGREIKTVAGSLLASTPPPPPPQLQPPPPPPLTTPPQHHHHQPVPYGFCSSCVQAQASVREEKKKQRRESFVRRRQGGALERVGGGRGGDGGGGNNGEGIIRHSVSAHPSHLCWNLGVERMDVSRSPTVKRRWMNLSHTCAASGKTQRSRSNTGISLQPVPKSVKPGMRGSALAQPPFLFKKRISPRNHLLTTQNIYNRASSPPPPRTPTTTTLAQRADANYLNFLVMFATCFFV